MGPRKGLVESYSVVLTARDCELARWTKRVAKFVFCRQIYAAKATIDTLSAAVTLRPLGTRAVHLFCLVFTEHGIVYISVL